MRVISYAYIRDFIRIHPDSSIALRAWYSRLKAARLENLNDLKKLYRSVDYVGNNRFVFNIKGNKYRIVAIVLFGPQKIFIRFIGTHEEYNKINCQEI